MWKEDKYGPCGETQKVPTEKQWPCEAQQEHPGGTDAEQHMRACH